MPQKSVLMQSKFVPKSRWRLERSETSLVYFYRTNGLTLTQDPSPAVGGSA
ncbi:MAG TPA: hypothetical protein VL136_03485 [Candidatus Babeliales bacterium]|nr:hypothetical protein [Candidatus Babeliales bacterium]